MKPFSWTLTCTFQALRVGKVIACPLLQIASTLQRCIPLLPPGFGAYTDLDNLFSFLFPVIFMHIICNARMKSQCCNQTRKYFAMQSQRIFNHQKLASSWIWIWVLAGNKRHIAVKLTHHTKNWNVNPNAETAAHIALPRYYVYWITTRSLETFAIAADLLSNVIPFTHMK